MAIQTLDMLSDCFFAVNVSIRRNMDSKYSLPMIFAIIFIVLPAFVTIFQLHFQCKRWIHLSDQVREWLSRNLKELYFLSFCTGSAFAAITLVNSYVFQLGLFDMGLTSKELKAFMYKRVYSVVLLENIPQLVLQIWFLSSLNTLDDAITITSIVLSVISILISVLSMLTERNIAQTQGYVSISMKITGHAVTSGSNPKRCKTLKRVLTEQLALLVGVHSSLVEVLKPSHIQQGFELNANFYFGDVNKTRVDYHKILLTACDTHQLQEVFVQSWGLSGQPDIYDMRQIIVEPTIARDIAGQMAAELAAVSANDIAGQTAKIHETAGFVQEPMEQVQMDHDVYSFVFESKPFGLSLGKRGGDKMNLYVTGIDLDSPADNGLVIVGSKVVAFENEFVEDMGANEIFKTFSGKYANVLPLKITFKKPEEEGNDGN
eukprot:41166_1